MNKPFVKIITLLPGVHELWLVQLAADGTIMPVPGSNGRIAMPEKWREPFAEAMRLHRARAEDAQPSTAASEEPSEEQIAAALRAACLHDTRESRKDMRKALMAAAALAKPVRPRKATDEELRDWIERNDLGSMGLTDARCVFEDAQSLCGFEPAR